MLFTTLDFTVFSLWAFLSVLGLSNPNLVGKVLANNIGIGKYENK